jgi:putative nucleotidyltransferase with HDIG domain
MATPVTPSKPPLGKVRSYILRMSGLSTTAMKVLRTCNEPNTCANDLNRVISLDPVLTGRVLQLVNSAYYSLPSKVNSLTRAIILLGINTVKNVVLGFAIFETFARHDSFRVFSADDFWAHSLSTAAAAKIMATAQGVPLSEREDFFIAGLMHDIGKIPLNHLFPDAYQEAAQLARASGQGMRSAEGALIGVDHCRVGLMIARKWELSDALTGALGRHHPDDDGKSDGLHLSEVVALADALAHDMGATIPGGLSLDHQGQRELKARWKLTADDLADLTGAVADEVEKAKVFLEIAAQR